MKWKTSEFRSEILKMKKEMTDEFVFLSERYLKLLKRIARQITSTNFANIHIDNDKSMPAGLYDGSVISVNLANPITQSFPSKELKSKSLIGILGHECGHENYSNTYLRERYLRGIREERKIYPHAPVPESPKEEDALASMEREFGRVRSAAVDLYCELAAYLSNILEDIYIELRMCSRFPGSIREGIKLNNVRIAELSQSVRKMLNEGEKKSVVILNMIAQYAISGQVNCWDGAEQEYLDCLDSCIPLIDKAVRDEEVSARYLATNQIMLKIWDFVMEDATVMERKQNEEERQQVKVPALEEQKVVESSPSSESADEGSEENGETENTRSDAGSQDNLTSSVETVSDAPTEAQGANSDSSTGTQETDLDSSTETQKVGSSASVKNQEPDSATSIGEQESKLDGLAKNQEQDVETGDLKPESDEMSGSREQGQKADARNQDQEPVSSTEGQESVPDASAGNRGLESEASDGNQESNACSLSGDSGSEVQKPELSQKQEQPAPSEKQITERGGTAENNEEVSGLEDSLETGKPGNNTSSEQESGTFSGDNSSDMELSAESESQIMEQIRNLVSNLPQYSEDYQGGRNGEATDVCWSGSWNSGQKGGIADAEKMGKDSMNDKLSHPAQNKVDDTDPLSNQTFETEGRPEFDQEASSFVFQLAKDMAEVERSEQLQESLRELISEIDFGDQHVSVHKEVVRALVPYGDYKAQYAEMERKLKHIKKRLHDRMLPILEKQKSRMESGMVLGRRLSSRNLYRPDHRIFARRQLEGNECDTAIALLIDLSGSMAGSRIEYARLAALTLYQFSVEADIPVTVYGHNTSEYYGVGETVCLYSYAEFGVLDEKDCYRIMDMHPDGCNRDGVAVRFVGELLRRRQERQKLFVLISDGRPNARGYGGEWARADLKEAKTQLEQGGITFLAAAIGDDRDIIREIYGECLDITDLRKLPELLAKRVLREIS